MLKRANEEGEDRFVWGNARAAPETGPQDPNGPRVAKIFPASEERYRDETKEKCSVSLTLMKGW